MTAAAEKIVSTRITRTHAGAPEWTNRSGEFFSSGRSLMPRNGVRVGRLWPLAKRIVGDVGSLGSLAARMRTADQIRVPTSLQYHRQAGWIHAFCRSACRRHGIEIEVVGTFPHTPSVVVSNHLGYLDPLVLCSLHPLLPVAKREVSNWPLIGNCGDRSGVMFVDRGNPHSGARVLRQAIAALRAGVSVLNFPEGTTSFGDSVYTFCRGIFGAAQIAGVPVVPLHVAVADRRLCWVGDDEFVPHFLDFSQRKYSRIRVNVCASLHPASFDTADELAAAAQQQIETQIALTARAR